MTQLAPSQMLRRMIMPAGSTLSAVMIAVIRESPRTESHKGLLSWVAEAAIRLTGNRADLQGRNRGASSTADATEGWNEPRPVHLS